ncbi:MAG: hypothetical protein QM737_16050 [Ferruginibacter sp.]
MEKILRRDFKEGTIYYTNRLEDIQIKQIKRALNKRTFVWSKDSKKYDTLFLTLREKKYLDSAIDKLYKTYWPDSLFTNSRRIPVDSFYSHIENRNKQLSMRKDGWKDQVNYSSTFQFSPIIYFRDKSIALFFYVRMCGGLCGVDDLCFYKLENDHYKFWILVYGGAY